MAMRKRFVGGNWKMNTTLSGACALSREVVGGVTSQAAEHVDVAVFPPFPYLSAVGAILRERSSALKLGAQDAWHQPDGAFTGEVSLSMLKDCGVTCVLTGHSERRHVIGESDELVALKTRAALAAGLVCVLCVGETLEQRLAGTTDAVNERQVRSALQETPRDHLDRLVIAYEPVWAIGTGKTATPEDAQDAHHKIRRLLSTLIDPEFALATRIIYGGSMKAANAPALLAQPDIDGGLIGGASLISTEFVSIVQAAAR